MSPQARVGLVSLVALALVLAGLTALRGGLHLRQREYELTIRFRNAAGATVGTPVRMAGVGIGEVKSVVLEPKTNQAAVTIAVRPADIPQGIPQGSHFAVTTTGFLGDQFISVIPGPPDAPKIPEGTREGLQGDESITLEALEQRVTDVAERIEKLVDNLNRLAGDPEVQGDLKALLRNTNEVTTIVRKAAVAIEQTTHQVQRLIDTDVAIVVADLRRMSRVMAGTAEQLQGFVETTTGDGVLARDLRATAASAREASERIARMAADLQGLINSENVGKAREIVEDTRETAREVRVVVHRANTVLERVDRLVPSDLQVPSLDTLARLDYEVWYAGQRAGHGIDVTLLPQAPRFYRLGLHDIGASNGFVFQIGQRLDEGVAARAGIFESQVGVGLDYRVLEPLWLNLDLYNLNQVTLDVAGRYQVAPNWRIALGGKSLLRQPIVFFGVGINY